MARAATRIIKWFVVCGALGGGVAYFALRKSAADAPVVFKTGKIDRGAVEEVVTATGQLGAVVTVQVGSQVSGIIQRLYADFNSQVREGQLLAQLDPTRFKASLQQSQANVKDAEAAMVRAKVNFAHSKRDYERARALADKNVIGEAELDDLKAKHELAEVEMASSDARAAQSRAGLNAARVDLERTTIRAPISGTVLQRAVDVGQTVAASLSAPTLFTIAQDLSKMEVRAAIDEADVGKLSEGFEARFTVDAYPGREFVATIHQIRSNPNVQQNVVTYDAILRVDNPEGKLRPGMTASVRIVSERKENVLRVPNAALRFKPPSEMVEAGTPGPGMRRGGDGGAPAAFAERGERGFRGGGPQAGGGRGDGMGFGGGAVARRGMGGGPEGGGFRGAARRGGAGGDVRVVARVYKAAGEKVITVPFRPGISDDQYTEVLFGPLVQGDEVVVDAEGGAYQQQDRPASSSSSSRSMRGGSSRGPRFF